MMTDLKHPAEKLFAQFESEAFAAASLGQVHRAILDNGQHLAVKIQYPGINIAIKNDMALMRGIARGMPNSKLILDSLVEIETRLMEEVDYKIEAKNTQWFRQNIKMEGIFVPKVYPEFSAQRVLTTEFIKGLHLDDWLATKPSKTQRNQMAQRLYDLFYYSSQELQCLHADPNPGNYLFHKDGSITVIDFGCVRKMSNQFTQAYPLIVKAYFEDDSKALFATYTELGMSSKDFSETFYQEVLRPFGQWVTLPYRNEHFDFSQHVNYTQDGKEVMRNLHKSFNVDHIVEEFIFHNRTYYGLLQIFEKMGATVCFNKR